MNFSRYLIALFIIFWIGLFGSFGEIFASDEGSGDILNDKSTSVKISQKRWSWGEPFASTGITSNDTLEEGEDIPSDTKATKKLINNSLIRLCRSQADNDHKKLEASFKKIYENEDDILEAFKSVRRTYVLHKKKNEVLPIEDGNIYSQNMKDILTICMNYRIESIDKKINANQK